MRCKVSTFLSTKELLSLTQLCLIKDVSVRDNYFGESGRTFLVSRKLHTPLEPPLALLCILFIIFYVIHGFLNFFIIIRTTLYQRRPKPGHPLTLPKKIRKWVIVNEKRKKERLYSWKTIGTACWVLGQELWCKFVIIILIETTNLVGQLLFFE